MAPRKKKRERNRKAVRKKPYRNFFPQELLDRLRKRMEKEQGKSDLSLAPTTEATTAGPAR